MPEASQYCTRNSLRNGIECAITMPSVLSRACATSISIYRQVLPESMMAGNISVGVAAALTKLPYHHLACQKIWLVLNGFCRKTKKTFRQKVAVLPKNWAWKTCFPVPPAGGRIFLWFVMGQDCCANGQKTSKISRSKPKMNCSPFPFTLAAKKLEMKVKLANDRWCLCGNLLKVLWNATIMLRFDSTLEGLLQNYARYL